MKKLAAVVDGRGIEWILGDARIPVKAKIDSRRLRVRTNKALFTGVQIPTRQVTALKHHVTAARILGIRERVETVTEANFLPVQVSNAGVFPYFGWASPGAIVLQSTIDVIWVIVVDGNVIKLGERQVAYEASCLTAIVRDSNTAITADDHMPGIVRINPECVIVDVKRISRDATINDFVVFESFSTVDRLS